MTKFCLFPLLLITAFFVSCSHRKPAYVKLAEERFAEGIEYQFNTDSTFVICLKQKNPVPTPQIPETPVSFFVYDIKQKELIYETQMIGEVVWQTNSIIAIIHQPGMIQKDEENTTRQYDVLARKFVN